MIVATVSYMELNYSNLVLVWMSFEDNKKPLAWIKMSNCAGWLQAGGKLDYANWGKLGKLISSSQVEETTKP